jgi:hypothetical protein
MEKKKPASPDQFLSRRQSWFEGLFLLQRYPGVMAILDFGFRISD